MNIFRKIYTYYSITVFCLLFFLLFPFFLIPILFPKSYFLVGVINRWWAYIYFILIFLPYRVECRALLDPKTKYIFCPNHFSFFDIPIMGLNPINTIFVGKNDMEKIPVFGFMYRKLHIQVDRSKLKSKFSMFMKSMEALDQGKSLVIYPEGGIYTKNPPQMAPFKDGPFRIAIEKQISIVPVTIPFNWIFLPTESLTLHWRPIRLIIHEPIDTKGMTIENVNDLKNKVYDVIESELKKYDLKS